jgi:hypothetical protein
MRPPTLDYAPLPARLWTVRFTIRFVVSLMATAMAVVFPTLDTETTPCRNTRKTIFQ